MTRRCSTPRIRAAPSSGTPRRAISASLAPTSSPCCISPACSPASWRSTTSHRATCSRCRSATCCPQSLSRPHAKHGSPHRASLWISGRRRGQRGSRRGVQARPGRTVLHLVCRATTVGVIILLIATSVAVLVFFGKDLRGQSQWRVRIAPALGLVGLLGSLVAHPHQSQVLSSAAPASWPGSSSDCSSRRSPRELSSGRGCRGQHRRHINLMTNTVDAPHSSAPLRPGNANCFHAIGDGSLTEIEVAWSDPFGHAQGKRIPRVTVPEPGTWQRIRLLRSVFGLEHRRHGRSTRSTSRTGLAGTRMCSPYPTSRRIDHCPGVRGWVT